MERNKILISLFSFVTEKRRFKEITDTYTTKVSDYTFLNSCIELDQIAFRSQSTFCVEIKPKQGYLPKTERRLPTCPYCLMQYTKVSMNNILLKNTRIVENKEILIVRIQIFSCGKIIFPPVTITARSIYSPEWKRV